MSPAVLTSRRPTPIQRAPLMRGLDDYFSVPVEQVGRTTALLTVVGGKVVHATGPLAGSR